jgi:hypothetical protein
LIFLKSLPLPSLADEYADPDYQEDAFSPRRPRPHLRDEDGAGDSMAMLPSLPRFMSTTPPDDTTPLTVEAVDI